MNQDHHMSQEEVEEVDMNHAVVVFVVVVEVVEVLEVVVAAMEAVKVVMEDISHKMR